MKYNWNIDKIKEAVKSSINLSEVLEKLGIPRQGNNGTTLRKILESNNIDYSHFTGRARYYRPSKISNIDNYLNNSVKVSTVLLKRLLFKKGLKENRCEVCGISSWNGKLLNCQLHHINGNHLDNRLENLQILCPNCHSQTDNYCRNANTKDKNTNKYCPDCVIEIAQASRRCSICAAKYRRKVIRPSIEILRKEKEHMSFCELGRKYKVSDNAIRKWLK